MCRPQFGALYHGTDVVQAIRQSGNLPCAFAQCTRAFKIECLFGVETMPVGFEDGVQAHPVLKPNSFDNSMCAVYVDVCFNGLFSLSEHGEGRIL